ncbi:hypothetical protein JCM8202_004865 [Rhodotorula sphaerocarpa]
MQLAAIHEELVVLTSSLLDGELAWEDDAARNAWEPVLSGGEEPKSDLPPPTLSLRLCDRAELSVAYALERDAPTMELHCARLEREDQAELTREFERVDEEIRSEDTPLPVFQVYQVLQEYLTANPPAPPAAAAVPAANTSAAQPRPSGPLQLKTTLLWSHHLLATSKRKDIIAWSHELELWGLARPGYPGVIIVEGLASNIDQFVQIVKSWQWKALQVRCEVDGEVVQPPKDVSPREAPTWAVRTRAQLGKVLDPEGRGKIGVREVEGLNELGEIMRSAGLEEVFLTAMKLQK